MLYVQRNNRKQDKVNAEQIRVEYEQNILRLIRRIMCAWASPDHNQECRESLGLDLTL